MRSAILFEILGTMRQAEFTPAAPRVALRLDANAFLIGSRPGQGPSVAIEDGTVSRKHAEVSLRGGAWHIKDLDSDNGMVLLHDCPVGFWIGDRVEEVPIADSATLALGAVVIRLTVAKKEA
jgi:pSer/pThr/pTyr-binding forkhead associated (FHA) protein